MTSPGPVRQLDLILGYHQSLEQRSLAGGGAGRRRAGSHRDESLMMVPSLRAPSRYPSASGIIVPVSRVMRTWQ